MLWCLASKSHKVCHKMKGNNQMHIHLFLERRKLLLQDVTVITPWHLPIYPCYDVSLQHIGNSFKMVSVRKIVKTDLLPTDHLYNDNLSNDPSIIIEGSLDKFI